MSFYKRCLSPEQINARTLARARRITTSIATDPCMLRCFLVQMMLRGFVALAAGVVLTSVVMTNAATVQAPSLRGENVDEQAGFQQNG